MASPPILKFLPFLLQLESLWSGPCHPLPSCPQAIDMFKLVQWLEPKGSSNPYGPVDKWTVGLRLKGFLVTCLLRVYLSALFHVCYLYR